MDSAQFKILRKVFEELQELPEGERAAALEARDLDPEVHAELRAMLGFHATPTFLETGYAEQIQREIAPPSDTQLGVMPEQIGPYRIVDELGHGGMGAVYLAEQSEPVRRQVALKVVKLGMDSEAILARFEQERQALALMNHDAVAKIFDAGITERGQPFFVMEYVGGQPFDRYCDERQLPIRERVRILQRVCEGMQHAHQKGVMHRDLKPTNILVAEVDGRHEPKIIDFGLARATDQTDLAHATLTMHGQMLGTPEYMSPEQAFGDSSAIDTRTDVYSLGVVLYQLLTGCLPFQSVSGSRDFGEIARVIREEMPTRPSTRFASSDSWSQSVALDRSTSVATLKRALRGDLDWIALKAMEKSPDRRYGSATEFAADLERYLRFEPVTARAPSLVYRSKRFARKYRVALATSGLLFAALTAGLIATLWQTGKLEAKTAEFDLLALGVKLDEAQDDASGLWPPGPDKCADIRSWLDHQAARLVDAIPTVRSALARLEARAVPRTEAERLARRPAHPDFAEYEKYRTYLEWKKRWYAVRSGAAEHVPFELSESMLSNEPYLLFLLGNALGNQKRARYDREAEGLAMLRAAIASFGDDDPRIHYYLTNLAMVLTRNGLEAEGLRVAEEALRLTPADVGALERELMENSVKLARQEVAKTDEWWREHIADYERQVAERSVRIDEDVGRRFEDPADGFLQIALVSLLSELEQFERVVVPDVEQRLRWSKCVEELTVTRYRERWHEARRAILAADDVVASKRYADVPFELDPQIGLVPIGMNPQSKLWEFYHLRSAWDGEQDPRQLDIPTWRDDRGGFDMLHRGFVFVLIPGGSRDFGAQAIGPDYGPNFDPMAAENEQPVQSVVLDPYFLSKFECTMGQWTRLMAQPIPSVYELGAQYNGFPDVVTEDFPIEAVTRHDAVNLTTRYGLLLPTEARWEVGCRGGTSTPWFCGTQLEDIEGFGNLLDARAASVEPFWPGGVEFDDGYKASAPVGQFAPNPFGIFDVIGNVSEWCLDGYRTHGIVRDGDGLRLEPEPGRWAIRGGSFRRDAPEQRTAFRNLGGDDVNSIAGLRPSRPVVGFERR